MASKAPNAGKAQNSIRPVSERLGVARDQGSPRNPEFGNPAALPKWPIRNLELPKRESEPEKVAHIYLLIDRSGSMGSIWDPTVESVNRFVARAKDSGESAVLTVAVFDDEFDVVVDHQPIEDVRVIDPAEFPPRGMTPLFDASGRMLVLADRRVVGGDVSPGDVLIVTVTDGGENASRRMSGDRLRQVIANREGHGYEFLYLGANQDSYAEAAKMGVSTARDWDASDEGTRVNMARAERLMRMKMGGERLACCLELDLDISEADRILADVDPR